MDSRGLIPNRDELAVANCGAGRYGVSMFPREASEADRLETESRPARSKGWRMRVKVFLALVCLTLSAAMASAQVPTGTISGRVTDSSGGVLPGVTVTATSPNLQGPRVAVTSGAGDYV